MYEHGLGSTIGQCHLLLTYSHTLSSVLSNTVADALWPLLAAISAIGPNNFGNYKKNSRGVAYESHVGAFKYILSF